MRLPASHAAITAPLVASDTTYPGIPIGRSLLDGRHVQLSPVRVDDRVLPATNSLGLGGLGSGKSTTAKARLRREILRYGHQAVVVDSFGENAAGEWGHLVRSLGGRVIEAGSFQLNPVSEMFPREVSEELVRSLITAVEPHALTTQAGHALQHALNHPKSTSLNGLLEALVDPQKGRWPVARLAEWGEAVAIALSRYTEGSLRGLFDGEDATLPETDLPILSFDFSRLDRNSPAIPALMAAVACWVEQVWLPQSTAVHRHFVLEEAWQILLSPETAELIQRLLKNSRKAGLSLDVIMHTLSDLGDGRAQDLARLCEVAHVGRLHWEEAVLVGNWLGLPQWAINRIPLLQPGQAVWKIGPNHVDIVETVLEEGELVLTDTSSRRRRAQEVLAPPVEAEDEAEGAAVESDVHDVEDGVWAEDELKTAGEEFDDTEGEDGWDWDLPPNVIDTRPNVIDGRHQDVLQAAREGRFSEAADLAAVHEREDIHAHGIHSDQAALWLMTRARVAELSGNRDQAAYLRATVAHMGNDVEWYEQSGTGDRAPDRGAQPPQPLPPVPASEAPAPPPKKRRAWRYVAAVAVVGVGIGAYLQQGSLDQEREERTATAAAYKGVSGAELQIDGIKVDVVAHWSSDRKRVVLELRSGFDRNTRYLRLDAGGQTASSVQEDGYFPKDPQLALPVEDPLAEVTVRLAVGGAAWKEGVRAPSRTVRLSPAGVAYDAETGRRLPSYL